MTSSNDHFAPEFPDGRTVELENRLRNLIWTIAGDYGVNDVPDVASFSVSRHIALYDAIWRGAFARFFDREEMILFVARKLFLGASEEPLMDVVQMACECAVHGRVCAQRAGVAGIRARAYSDLADFAFGRLSSTMTGRIRLALVRAVNTGSDAGEARLRRPVARLLSLDDPSTGTQDVLRAINDVYNSSVDPGAGDFEAVQAVTVEDLRGSKTWKEYAEAIYGQEDPAAAARAALTHMSSLTEGEKNSVRSQRPARIVIDQESLSRVERYIDINFGESVLSPREQARLDSAVCRGMHEGCTVRITRGVLRSRVQGAYRVKYAERQFEKNRIVFYDNHRAVKRGVALLTDIIKGSMAMRAQRDLRPSDNGSVNAGRLWRVGRTKPGKLFVLTDPQPDFSFAVDILIDASGSQSYRQSKVALQAYIISEALSNAGIRHRVTSYCSFWDYTILRLFRDFEDGREANASILEFSTSANNRDGLAIRAAVHSLSRRPEENRILIVLSDGRPNDMSVNRPGSRQTEGYTGDEAVRDTAYEVRFARAAGVRVLGVFSGMEEDLRAEKMIFGKDFTYIRDISNISRLVGAYLKKLIEND